MLNSQPLSDWLNHHYSDAFFSSLKRQKFLFFYEALSNIDHDHAECQSVNDERAGFAGFLVSVLSETELSEIAGQFKHEDLSQEDGELLGKLRSMYSPEYIASVSVISVADKNFVIPQPDLEKLTEDHRQVFVALANEPELQNPVCVSISDQGVVLVD